MGVDEDYSVKVKSGKGLRPFYPLIGLLLMGAFGAIAYVLGPLVTNTLDQAGYLNTVDNTNYETVQLIVSGVIFFALVLFGALIFAVAAPKSKTPANTVTERGLDRERKARMQADLDAKKRRKKVRNEMAKARKQQSK
jgi:hypothetical protein